MSEAPAGFGPADATWRAPGRVNVIGEHTDYNEGFVLPIALPLGVTGRVARRLDGRLRLASAQAGGEPVELAVDELRPGRPEGWAGYAAGVVWALLERGGEVTGADVWLDGDVPAGSGLSSSAALECAVATAVDAAFDLGLSRDDLVAVARSAENDFVGVPSGMLDQSASMLCTAGAALLLDCRSGERRQVPLDLAAAGLALLVVDTRAPHRHADGEYAARRADCTRAAELLGVPALRDVGLDELSAVLDRLPDARLRRRVRHVVTENQRVLDTVAALDAAAADGSGLDADAARVIGRLLTASHESLRDDFEVSSRELDLAVEAAVTAGAFGARMTGGGFGGSAIALIAEQQADTVTDAVTTTFRSTGLRAPTVFAAVPSEGAHPVRTGTSRAGGAF